MHEWKHTFLKINKHKQMHQVQGCILSYTTIKHYSYEWKHTHTTPLHTCIHTHTHTHTHTYIYIYIYILQTQIPA